MKCPNLRQLCVSKCGELTDSTLVALANFNPQLSTLEVAGCHQFTDIGFQALGKVSHHTQIPMKANEPIRNLSELQIFRENGSGGMQSDYRSYACSLGDRMSEPGETCTSNNLDLCSISLLIFCTFADTFTLRTHNWWWNPTAGGWKLCRRKPLCSRVRQLPTHYGCYTRASNVVS